jgi:hypothetical protein
MFEDFCCLTFDNKAVTEDILNIQKTFIPRIGQLQFERPVVAYVAEKDINDVRPFLIQYEKEGDRYLCELFPTDTAKTLPGVVKGQRLAGAVAAAGGAAGAAGDAGGAAGAVGGAAGAAGAAGGAVGAVGAVGGDAGGDPGAAGGAGGDDLPQPRDFRRLQVTYKVVLFPAMFAQPSYPDIKSASLELLHYSARELLWDPVIYMKTYLVVKGIYRGRVSEVERRKKTGRSDLGGQGTRVGTRFNIV